MRELIDKVHDKLKIVFKYDQKYLDIINKDFLKVTFEYDGDDEKLVRMTYSKDNLKVIVTRYELLTVKTVDEELKMENKILYETWEEFLEA